LVFIPFACLGTGLGWGSTYIVEELGLKTRVVRLAFSLMISSGIGASILWGWGFDSVPSTMMKLWTVTALSSVLCYFGSVYGFFEAMSIFTVMFSTMTYTATIVFFLSYLTHHNKDEEVSVVSAWMAIWFIAELVTFFCMEMFRNSILGAIYLGIMCIISVFIAWTREWLCET